MTEPLNLLPAYVQAEMIASAEISSTELLNAHLKAIESLNDQVNAICTLDVNNALSKAKWLDNLSAKGHSAGPLHGLVIGIKDTHLTKGIRTTFGSPIYRDLIPNQSQLHVKLLENAGAVVIGKTNVPELAAGSQTTNPVFGSTKNPYDLTKTVGGSSGGAAAALACGMVSLADGSDMGGSIRNPASFCNLFGLRPTPGLVPRHPVKDPWNNLSVTGPIARNAKDLGLLLSVLAQWSPLDPLSKKGANVIYHPSNWVYRNDNFKIAASPDLGFLPIEPEVRSLFEDCVTRLRAEGIAVNDDAPSLKSADTVFKVLRGYTFAGTYENEYLKFKHLINNDIVKNIEYGLGLSALDIYKARTVQGELFSSMNKFLDNNDVLLMPTVQTLPFDVNLRFPTQIDGIEMETYIDWMASCYLLSILNMPIVSIPVGISRNGLPFGVQAIGKPGTEYSLLMLSDRLDAIFKMSLKQPPISS